MIRVVFDTNVYISALFWRGTPFYLFQKFLRGEIANYISPQILKEIEEKLFKKFNLPHEKVAEFLEIIAINSNAVYPKRHIRIVECDPSDNKIIECALDAKASYIISGDKDLLDIGKYKNIEIFSPKEFYEKTK